MMKLAVYAVVFLLGAAGGIYWGVNHPTQAQSIHDAEHINAMKLAAFAQGKQAALQQVVNDQTSPVPPAPGTTPATVSASRLDKYKVMLQNAQQELNDAKSKVGN